MPMKNVSTGRKRRGETILIRARERFVVDATSGSRHGRRLSDTTTEWPSASRASPEVGADEQLRT